MLILKRVISKITNLARIPEETKPCKNVYEFYCLNIMYFLEEMIICQIYWEDTQLLVRPRAKHRNKNTSKNSAKTITNSVTNWDHRGTTRAADVAAVPVGLGFVSLTEPISHQSGFKFSFLETSLKSPVFIIIYGNLNSYFEFPSLRLVTTKRVKVSFPI